MVYPYEGPLNKINNASDETILKYYSHRWTIEVLFCSHKR